MNPVNSKLTKVNHQRHLGLRGPRSLQIKLTNDFKECFSASEEGSCFQRSVYSRGETLKRRNEGFFVCLFGAIVIRGQGLLATFLSLPHYLNCTYINYRPQLTGAVLPHWKPRFL